MLGKTTGSVLVDNFRLLCFLQVEPLNKVTSDDDDDDDDDNNNDNDDSSTCLKLCAVVIICTLAM